MKTLKMKEKKKGLYLLSPFTFMSLIPSDRHIALLTEPVAC